VRGVDLGEGSALRGASVAGLPALGMDGINVATNGATATVVGGIIVSLAIIAATFPILTRITDPEVARND
jgi:hypothetical protein